MELNKKKNILISELIDMGHLKDKKILEIFKKIPREKFVLPRHIEHAYVNEPLPILKGQTISQPLTVVAMTEALEPRHGQKILEIGTGSGYQAAILSELVGRKGMIITVERIKELCEFAKNNLKKYKNVTVVSGDGSQGYERYAPYDRIIVTASAPDVPKPLLNQLKDNGRLVIPIRDEMFAFEKHKGKISKTFLGYYAFVPLVGKHGH